MTTFRSESSPRSGTPASRALAARADAGASESGLARLGGGLWRRFSQLTCSHEWIRARRDDGAYGLRCRSCMKVYPVTFNDLLDAGRPAAAPTPELVPAPAARPLAPQLVKPRRPMVA